MNAGANPANTSKAPQPVSIVEGFTNRLHNSLNVLGIFLDRMERRLVNFEGPAPTPTTTPIPPDVPSSDSPLRHRLESSLYSFEDLLSRAESIANRLEASF